MKKSEQKTLSVVSALMVRCVAVIVLMFAGAVQVVADDVRFPQNYVVSGYDLVSYFEAESPLVGNEKYTVLHNGERYAFSSRSNKALFESSPEQYLPEYGAYCAYGMANGMQLSVDPTIWEIVDNRLFFLINPATKADWKQDMTGNIHKGDKIWKKLSAAI